VKERITRILLLDIVLYIIFYFLTNFVGLVNDIYIGWGIVLISKDLRLLILPLNYLLIETYDRIFWLFLALVIFCIPTDIATVIRLNSLFNIFAFFKIVIAFFLIIEVYKKYKELK
jgi:hypothetical protein